MSRRQNLFRRALGLLFSAAVALPFATAAQALPIRGNLQVAYEGSCDAAPPVGLSRLWLGHFTGGRYAHHFDGHPRITTHFDWVAEYRCFSSRARCDAWQRSMHRAFGRIEGYWTCLPLR